jgi:hypothetical protein
MFRLRGQQLVVPAVAAAKPQETVRQDAALEKGIELVLDEPRQLAAGAGFGVCPPLRGLLQGPAYRSDRPLRGDEFRAADVGSGSPCKAFHSDPLLPMASLKC